MAPPGAFLFSLNAEGECKKYYVADNFRVERKDGPSIRSWN